MTDSVMRRYMRLIERNLVEYGFVQPEVIKSDAFKQWFANSRVRRRDGSPAVVYHGTGSDVPSFRGMVWATHNQRLANEYAGFRGIKGGNPTVIPLFMRIEHPLDAERLPRTVTVKSFFEAVFKQAYNQEAVAKAMDLLPIIQQGRHEEESGPHYSPHDFWFETRDMFGRRGSEAIFTIYKMLGFDGIRDWESNSDTWGAFSPTQVKSAFNSTFDASSSHISETVLDPRRDFYAFHGTSSRFLESIREHGLLPAPKERVFDTDLIAHTGAYFSDTFAVALWASTRAVAKFGGKSIVVICDIEATAMAGDEDDVIEFLQNLQGETPEEMANEYAEYYDQPAPDLFYQLIRLKNLHSPRARKMMDAMTRAMGRITRASGNGEAISFRVPAGVPASAIVAILLCSWSADFDPSYLPRDLRYDVVYGAVPHEVAIR